jgi:hypothetical protein
MKPLKLTKTFRGGMYWNNFLYPFKICEDVFFYVYDASIYNSSFNDLHSFIYFKERC